MNRFEEDLPEQELDEMLATWKSPPAPGWLRAALFPDSSVPWWRRIWQFSFRVPLPVACLLALLIAVIAWRPARVVIQTQRVEVPVVKVETVTVYRDRVVRVPQQMAGWNQSELQPVTELRPRIIRRQNAEN